MPVDPDYRRYSHAKMISFRIEVGVSKCVVKFSYRNFEFIMTAIKKFLWQHLYYAHR